MRRQADIRIPPHHTNSLDIKELTSSQDAGIGDTLCLLTQAKKDNKFKNKKSPELPENQTVWKSDNHDLKKKHSFRLVEGVETAARKERTGSKEVVADQVVLLLCADNQEE